jgi:hypothetical protein
MPTQNPTTFIVMNIDVPCKCNLEDFEITYQEIYKANISHTFIRESLGLSDTVKIKFNGTFDRWFYFSDESNNFLRKRFRIQTALWKDPITSKAHYISIFPEFIKRYLPVSLHLIEILSATLKKREDIFKHFGDPNNLFTCEDPLVKILKGIDKKVSSFKYVALLNSRYTEVFNRSLAISESTFAVEIMRFPQLFSLVLFARAFFTCSSGSLACTNFLLRL